MHSQQSSIDVRPSFAAPPLASTFSRRDETPLDELRLAAELARVMQRAPRRTPRPQPLARPVPRRSAPAGSTREALASLLVRHANPLTPSRLAAPRAEPEPPLSAVAAAPSEAVGDLPPLAAAWLQRSRRSRARARLAEAASWSLTVGVGALGVAAAVWLLLGWPGDSGAVQRLGSLDRAADARPRL